MILFVASANILNMNLESPRTKIRTTLEMIKDRVRELKFPSSTEFLPITEINQGEDIPDISLLVGKKYIYIYRKDIINKDHIHANVQIWRVELDDELNPVSFIKDREDSLVSETFDMLNSIPFFWNIRTDFGIPNLGAQAREDARKIKIAENSVAEWKQRQIDEIRELAVRNTMSESRQTLDKPDQEVVSISQWEIWYLEGNEDWKKYLETLWAGPCIVITARNKSGQSVMTHMDALTDEKIVLQKILTWDIFDIRIFGWDESSIQQLVSVKEELDKHSITATEWDILNSSKSIIMDSITWEIFDVSSPRNRSDASIQSSEDMYLRSMLWKQDANIKNSS